MRMISAALMGLSCVQAAADNPLTFRTLRLTDSFYCEGADAGDFNRDGQIDIVSGPFIYEGPGFVFRREIYPPASFDPHGYSENFLTFSADIDRDGWADIIQVGWPGKETVWYRNPGESRNTLTQNSRGHWDRFVAFAVTDNESPGWADITGDDVPELICQTDGRYGYAAPDLADPTKLWPFTAVSERKESRGRFTHGLGVGDVNGDGRNDLLAFDGWWEHPATQNSDGPWQAHPVDFAPRASQMFTLDVNGDGRNDVITALDAHGYGLAWHEQQPDGKFDRHMIMKTRGEKPASPVVFSQPHAMAMADVNGDGRQDIVTGKRFWAHGPTKDVEPEATPVVYAFLLTGKGDQTTFEPALVSDSGGVGTQVTVADLNADGKPDVLVGNKLGTFVHLQQ